STPWATCRRRFPCASITPHPVSLRPGSSPITRIASPPSAGPEAGRSCSEPFDHLVGDVEVRGHLLHVVAVVERIEQLEKGRRLLLGDRRGVERLPDQPRLARVAELLDQGVAHPGEVVRLA